MHATQGKLVALHKPGKHTQSGAKVCAVLTLLCKGCHIEYAGHELTGRGAIRDSAKSDLVSSLLPGIHEHVAQRQVAMQQTSNVQSSDIDSVSATWALAAALQREQGHSTSAASWAPLAPGTHKKTPQVLVLAGPQHARSMSIPAPCLSSARLMP